MTQQIIAFSLLAVAVGYLVWKFFGKKKNGGCGPDCNCG